MDEWGLLRLFPFQSVAFVRASVSDKNSVSFNNSSRKLPLKHSMTVSAADRSFDAVPNGDHAIGYRAEVIQCRADRKTSCGDCTQVILRSWRRRGDYHDFLHVSKKLA